MYGFFTLSLKLVMMKKLVLPLSIISNAFVYQVATALSVV